MSATPAAARHSLPWLLSLLLHASLAGLLLVLPTAGPEQEQLAPIEIVQRELPPPPKLPEPPEPPPPEEQPAPQPAAAISQQAPPVRRAAPRPQPQAQQEPQEQAQPQDTGPKTFGIEMSGTTTAAPGTGVQVPVGDSLRVSPTIRKRGPKAPPPPRQGFKQEYAPSEVAPVAALTTKPKLRQPVVPEYPERMRELGIEGRVYLEVTVDAQGKVAAVRLLKGLHPELDALALKAARQLRFDPATVNGKPVRTKIPVPFTFVLD